MVAGKSLFYEVFDVQLRTDGIPDGIELCLDLIDSGGKTHLRKHGLAPFFLVLGILPSIMQLLFVIFKKLVEPGNQELVTSS